MQKKRVSAIAAIGRNRELGKENELLWHIPDDLKRVRALTMGHPLVMGRKTFDSIIAMRGSALPGRTSVVVTRDINWAHDGAIAAHTIDDGIAEAQWAPGGEEVFIFGGAQIYELAIPFVDRLCLTLIDDEKDADSFFPPYENEFTCVMSDKQCEYEGLKYRWVELGR